MIVIRYEERPAGNLLEVAGHANYSSRGTDIVCAGVSALTYAFLQAVLDHGGGDSGWVHNGQALIKWHDSPEIDAAAKVIIGGYRLIADQYPEHVKLVVPDA